MVTRLSRTKIILGERPDLSFEETHTLEELNAMLNATKVISIDITQAPTHEVKNALELAFLDRELSIGKIAWNLRPYTEVSIWHKTNSGTVHMVGQYADSPEKYNFILAKLLCIHLGYIELDDIPLAPPQEFYDVFFDDEEDVKWITDFYRETPEAVFSSGNIASA